MGLFKSETEMKGSILFDMKLKMVKLYGILRLFFRIIPLCFSAPKKPRLVLLNIPSHGNLGDHLIAKAELKFFEDNFKDYDVLCFTTADLYYSVRLTLSCVKREDIVCITGGGFLGSIWPNEEYRIRKIVKLLPNNKIIFFPQTVFYAEDEHSQQMLKETTDIYQKHHKLYFFARDTASCNLCREKLFSDKRENVFLVPDMALYLNFECDSKRKNILFCLRKDREKTSDSEKIVDTLKTMVSDDAVLYTDTVVPYTVKMSQQENEIKKKIKEFASAKLVVTDRLHGMIFAAISGTPVIAMDNVSKKVKQVYDLWLQDCEYVKLVENEQEAIMALRGFSSLNNCRFNNEDLKRKFSVLENVIRML